jgi:hypothetical protein
LNDRFGEPFEGTSDEDSGQRSFLMKKDEFGNLRDWGSVMDRLEKLREDAVLDEHQAGLARILRYRNNWRLREAALEGIQYVEEPSDELLTGVLDIVADRGLYREVRVLAARALEGMLEKRRMQGGGGAGGVPSEIVERTRSVLQESGTSVLLDAVRKSLAAIDES